PRSDITGTSRGEEAHRPRDRPFGGSTSGVVRTDQRQERAEKYERGRALGGVAAHERILGGAAGAGGAGQKWRRSGVRRELAFEKPQPEILIARAVMMAELEAAAVRHLGRLLVAEWDTQPRVVRARGLHREVALDLEFEQRS